MSRRILLITTDFPPRRGGVARYYAGIFNNLPAVSVLTDIGSAATDSHIMRQPLLYRFIWPQWLPLLWLVPYYRFFRQIEWCLAGQILPIGTALWIIKKTFGWRYGVFVHGFDLGLAKLNRRKLWLVRQILGSADVVVANSQFTADLARASGALENLIIVYPCSDLAVQNVAADSVSQLTDEYCLAGKTVILTVARLVKRKNIALVIESIAALHNDFADLVYVVVGDGPEMVNLRHQAKLFKVPTIWRGDIDDAELAVWYNLCDLFVLVPLANGADIEGFGIVYLEAQAAAKPVIGSPVGGVSEAVGGAGLLAKDKIELVEALRQLLLNPALRSKLGNLGRERVNREFIWPRQLKKLSAFFYDRPDN
ncbi:MAG: glycosyltransferase family 4 protein [Patescibacteria group bacterium]